MLNSYLGPERRKFIRLDYSSPLNYKICNQQIISKLFEGYTVNISERGVLCTLKEKVNLGDILWLSFDKGALSLFEDIDKHILIYQSGIIGKVARIDHKENDSFNIGVHFLMREEKNITNIFPQVHFSQEHAPLNPDDKTD